jgi:hypothetical protein
MMKKLLVAALSGAALSLSGASPPSSAKQTEHKLANGTSADPGRTIAGSRKTFQARVNEAIAELCPDDTLSGAQKSCELRARVAVQAQIAEEPPQN